MSCHLTCHLTVISIHFIPVSSRASRWRKGKAKRNGAGTHHFLSSLHLSQWRTVPPSYAEPCIESTVSGLLLRLLRVFPSRSNIWLAARCSARCSASSSCVASCILCHLVYTTRAATRPRGPTDRRCSGECPKSRGPQRAGGDAQASPQRPAGAGSH